MHWEPLTATASAVGYYSVRTLVSEAGYVFGSVWFDRRLNAWHVEEFDSKNLVNITRHHSVWAHDHKLDAIGELSSRCNDFVFNSRTFWEVIEPYPFRDEDAAALAAIKPPATQ